MAVAAISAQMHREIEEYGLRRDIDYSSKPSKAFLDRYIPHNDPDDWVYHDISDGPRVVHRYAYSSAHDCYIDIFAWHSSTAESVFNQFQNMRYQDMMVDNILRAGGNLETLRFMCSSHIDETDLHWDIRTFFESQDLNVRDATSIELRPSDPAFIDCCHGIPIVRLQSHLVAEYSGSTGGAFISRVILISEGYRDSPSEYSCLQPVLHVITELARPIPVHTSAESTVNAGPSTNGIIERHLTNGADGAAVIDGMETLHVE